MHILQYSITFQLFKDDMDQLIHIVLHHIPPVIPMDGDYKEDKSRKTVEMSRHFSNTSKDKQLSREEEIEAIERKISLLKELVMAQGSYRQNLLKSMKTAITLNTTFLILSHLSV